VQANVEIQSLPTFTNASVVSKNNHVFAELHGYWKYADAVVPFQIEPIDRPTVAPSFMPRARKPVVQKELKQQALKLVSSSSTANANGNGNGKRGYRVHFRMIDDLDNDFLR